MMNITNTELFVVCVPIFLCFVKASMVYSLFLLVAPKEWTKNRFLHIIVMLVSYYFFIYIMNPQLFYSIYFPEEINRGTISSVVDENSTNKSKSPLTENIVAAGLAGGAAILAAAVSSKTMAPAAAAKAFAGT